MKAHSKDNQGPWLKKTMVSLWVITGTSKGRMIDVLKIVMKQTHRRLRSKRRKGEEQFGTFYKGFAAAKGDEGRLEPSWAGGENPDHDVRKDR